MSIKVSRLVGAMMIVFMLAVAMLIGMPKTAFAGTACDRTGICGDVYHHPASETRYLSGTCSWPNTSGSSVRSAARGTSLSCKDVDGYHVPRGCRGIIAGVAGSRASGWYKITDNQNVSVRLDC